MIRTLLKYSLVVILLIFVSGMVVGYAFSLKSSKMISFNPLPLTQQDPTASWETYLNSDFGYSFKYPKGWSMDEWNMKDDARLTSVPNGSIWQQVRLRGDDKSFEVIVWENASQAPVRSWISWYRHEDLILKDVPTEFNVQVGGIAAISYLQHDTGRKKPLHFIFFGKGSKVYELVFERSDAGVATIPADLPVNDVYDTIRQSFLTLPPVVNEQ